MLNIYVRKGLRCDKIIIWGEKLKRNRARIEKENFGDRIKKENFGESGR